MNIFDLQEKLRADWLGYITKSFTASLLKNNSVLSQKYVSEMVDASSEIEGVVCGMTLKDIDTGVNYEVILTPLCGLYIGKLPAYVVRNTVNKKSQALTRSEFYLMFISKDKLPENLGIEK